VIRRWSIVFLAAAALPAVAVSLPPAGAPRCAVFPRSNPWNRDISRLSVSSASDTLVSAIGLDARVHPDFSAQGGYGIPINFVGRGQRAARVSFDYSDESDRVRYPIPARPRIEGGSDRHLLIVDRDACRLYELFDAQRQGGAWHAGSGAVFDLRSNRLRPDGWTSADAAGLPIMPGLVRYDEVARGRIDHVLRFTAPRTRSAHIFPARHDAGSSDPSLPPMGLRVRLRASASLAGLGPQARVIARAMKRYGLILADNGSAWYVTGEPDPRWNDDDLHGLDRFTGRDFQVVRTGASV